MAKHLLPHEIADFERRTGNGKTAICFKERPGIVLIEVFRDPNGEYSLLSALVRSVDGMVLSRTTQNIYVMAGVLCIEKIMAGAPHRHKMARHGSDRIYPGDVICSSAEGDAELAEALIMTMPAWDQADMNFVEMKTQVRV